MSVPHWFKRLFSEGLVDDEGRIVGDGSTDPFVQFFTFMNNHFSEVSEHEVLHHADSGKGIGFLSVAEAIKGKDDLVFGESHHDYANVVRLNEHNFHFLWQHGIEGKQNFCFAIYFLSKNLESDKGERFVKEGYRDEFLQTLLAASPDRARTFAQHGVLRVRGRLPWKHIDYVGFRCRNSVSKQWFFKYYKL